METFTLAIRRVFRYVFLCMAAMSFLWAFLPEHRLFLQSLLLGSLISVVNGLVLLSKTWRVGRSAVDPAVRPKGTGMFQRIVTVLFAAYLTIRFPEMFVISGVLIGVFLVPFFSLLFVYRSFK